MEYYLVVYSSITLARRVKKQITKDGSSASVIHTPKCISKGGCSYSVRIKKNKLPEIKEISSDFDIQIMGVYKESKVKDEKVYERVE